MPETKDITDPSVKFSTHLGCVPPISHDEQVRKACVDGCKDGTMAGYADGWERGFDAGVEDCNERNDINES